MSIALALPLRPLVGFAGFPRLPNSADENVIDPSYILIKVADLVSFCEDSIKKQHQQVTRKLLAEKLVLLLLELGYTDDVYASSVYAVAKRFSGRSMTRRQFKYAMSRGGTYKPDQTLADFFLSM
jgi:hypothetical protein